MLLVRAADSSALVRAACLTFDGLGAPVYITGPAVGGVYQVSSADADDPAKMPAIGFIESKPTPTTCIVRTSGVLLGIVVGLTVNKPVFVGPAGSIVQPPLAPATSPFTYTQILGHALSGNAILVDPEFTLTKRRG